MTQSSPQPTRQFRGKLTRTSLLLLLPLILIPVAILGMTTLYNTYTFLREQIISQFSDVGDKQAALISASVKSRENFLQTIAEDTTFRLSLDNLLESEPNSETFQTARGGMLTNYERINRTQDERHFDYFLIVSPENQILVSTYPIWEGKNIDQSVYEELLFKSSSVGLFKVSPFHTEEFTDRLLIFSSQRVYDEFGNHTGTMLGITGSSPFQGILELGTLSYAEARPYYITSPSREGVFIGLSSTTEELTTFSPSPDHTDIVMPKIASADKEGVLEFESFDNEPVLAFIKWIPSIEAALVLEVPQSVILTPLQDTAYLQAGLLAIGLLTLTVVIWQGTQRIVQPILQVSRTAQHFADGDMQARAIVNRNDEIGLLAYSFNQVADQLVTLYRSLETQVISRTQQIQTAAEVAQIITSATTLEDMLSRTVNLIVNRFNYYHVAIYLVDRSGSQIVLREAAGQSAEEHLAQGLRLAVGSRSIVGTVSASNEPWVAYDVKQDPYYLELESLPETQSEVAVPLSIGDQVLGVLDVQSNKLKDFEEEDITTLQTLARQVASALQNVRLLENTQIDLQSTSLLYQTSHQLATAEEEQEVFQILAESSRQIPFISAVFEMRVSNLQSVTISSDVGANQNREISIPLSDESIQYLSSLSSEDIIRVSNPPQAFPKAMNAFAGEINCQAFVVMPLFVQDQFFGLILIGTTEESVLTTVNLEPYNSITEMANTALEKIKALAGITGRLAELQSLNAISQAISTQTELTDLFAVLHRQISQAMGDVNFLIALFDTETSLIEIPYMSEGEDIISIPTFPLGQGLTSIVIRTQQPLMIVDDTVNRSRALGAIITSDRPALSWLGVPMLVGGEVVGAIVIQDTEQEQRFDDNDLRLLTTLAGQVAPTVRNTRLLANAQEAAERDRRLYEITDAIRQANSMQDILKITTQELSEALDLQSAKIEISVDPVGLRESGNGSEEASP